MTTIVGEKTEEEVSRYQRKKNVFYAWSDEELREFIISADQTQLRQLIELLAQAEKARGPN